MDIITVHSRVLVLQMEMELRLETRLRRQCHYWVVLLWKDPFATRRGRRDRMEWMRSRMMRCLLHQVQNEISMSEICTPILLKLVRLIWLDILAFNHMYSKIFLEEKKKSKQSKSFQTETYLVLLIIRF